MQVTRVALLAGFSLCANEKALEDGLRAFSEGRYQQASQLLEKAPTGPVKEVFLNLSQVGAQGCVASSTAVADLATRSASLGDTTLRRMAILAVAPCLRAPEALTLLASLEKDNPKDPDVLYQIARVQMKAWNETVYAMYQRTPASYRVNQLSAEILELQGKLPEAEAEFRKAITKSPQALNLHFRLGRVLLLQAQGAEALAAARAEFEKELALNPGDAAAEFQVGQLLIAEGKPEAAMPRLEAALKLKPEFPEAMLALAKVEVQRKNFGRAIPLLEELVKLQPNHEGGHYNLMLAYRNSGQATKAQAEKAILDKLQKPPEGEFTEFLKKLGEKKP